MLDKLWTDLRTASTQVRDRRQALLGRARHRAFLARSTGQERMWTFQTTALEEVEGWLEHTADLPVIKRVTTPVERLVHDRLEASLALPVEGYDEMNAKTAIRSLRNLDHLDLLRVRRREEDHKARKTVLEAVEKELERYFRPPDLAAA